MDSLAALINELSELRRFKCDITVTLAYEEYGRKSVAYDDNDLEYIADGIGKIIKENKELKAKLALAQSLKEKEQKEK